MQIVFLALIFLCLVWIACVMTFFALTLIKVSEQRGIELPNEAKNLGVNYQEKMVFYAQDIDRIAALMCYIQLSLLGCKAFVKIGNSLTDPLTENEPLNENIWLTPMLAGETIFKMFGLQAGRKGKHDVVEEGIQPDEDSDKSRQPLEGKVSA